MNPVSQFESFIERLMERIFTRATHSQLQPVEIGKRLVRAMESDQQVGVDGIMVPNVYDVYLNADDFAYFAPQKRSLTQNLEAHVARTSRQKGFHLVSRPIVTFHEDDRVNPGDIKVSAHMKDVESPATIQVQHTSILPTVDDVGIPQRERPTLILEGRPFAILRSPTVLGRSPESDIVINDSRVSRRHAEIVQTGTRWSVRDLGSTNGTLTNGKMVKEALLRSGDLLSFGGVETRWEQ